MTKSQDENWTIIISVVLSKVEPPEISSVQMQNHVSHLRCYKISAAILFFQRETCQLYSLKFTKNILLTKKENQQSFQEITLTSFPKKK